MLGRRNQKEAKQQRGRQRQIVLFPVSPSPSALAALRTHKYLHDVDWVEVWVAEGQLPAQQLVALDQLLILRNIEDLPGGFSQPPASNLHPSLRHAHFGFDTKAKEGERWIKQL